MADKKQYGLILPKKHQLSAPQSGNVFGNEDDSEEEEGTDWVKKALKAENEKNKIKKQTKLNMQKALKENPTIYQYDEIYDQMERTKEEIVIKKTAPKAKYIENLLKSADLRKKEQELRKDRMIQKEIEAEDAMFPDKERFVTTSYKAKLEEMKRFEEEQENQDRLEAIADVTKQQDMSGFYRHLYRQTVDRNNADLGIVPLKVEKPKEKNNDVKVGYDMDKDEPIVSNSESEESGKSDGENVKEDSVKSLSAITRSKNKRQYRKRAAEASEPESDNELQENNNEAVAEESKADEIKDDNALENKVKKQKLLDTEERGKPLIKDDSSLKVNNDSVEKPSKDSTIDNGRSAIIAEEVKPKAEVKKKINIWAKRTVGQVFDDALQRYLIRKQERLAGC